MPNWEKRANNREESKKLLIKAGIIFSERNCGAHLIMFRNDKQIDFWPGTGLYRCAEGEGRGVENLIKYLKSFNEYEPIAIAVNSPIFLSVEQIFDIAKKCNGSLYDRCDAIHKAIYKKGDQ